jgi:hypothetical protein
VTYLPVELQTTTLSLDCVCSLEESGAGTIFIRVPTEDHNHDILTIAEGLLAAVIP